MDPRMVELEQLDAQRAGERPGEAGDVHAEAFQPSQLPGHERETGRRIQHDADQYEGRQEQQQDRGDEQATPH